MPVNSFQRKSLFVLYFYLRHESVSFMTFLSERCMKNSPTTGNTYSRLSYELGVVDNCYQLSSSAVRICFLFYAIYSLGRDVWIAREKEIMENYISPFTFLLSQCVCKFSWSLHIRFGSESIVGCKTGLEEDARVKTCSFANNRSTLTAADTKESKRIHSFATVYKESIY